MTLPTQYQNFIHKSRYARWNYQTGKRETWDETVYRYINYWERKFPEVVTPEIAEILYDDIHQLRVMPSMRALMTAGKALDRDNVAGFNCSFAAIDSVRKFDEIMYVLMCGTGVGFSVERQFVQKLPSIAEEFHKTDTVIKVSDSKIGWASAFRELIALLYAGKIPKWDLSKLRPAGALLKTFGGRASGPEPLDSLFRFTVELFTRSSGRKLTSIECHDLVCKIAEIVVVGGVRRSALISLSNLSDDRMRLAKSGAWWEQNVQRALANNSAVYSDKPDIGIFMKEWLSLYESKSGERGIFNREAANKRIPERRKEFGYIDFGTNPCGEIILRSAGFCNLSEIIIRPDDTLDRLKEKARVATILGTLQSTLTNFRYLSAEWKKNADEERLLGVSLTGIMDHKVLSRYGYFELKDWLTELKKEVINTNKEWADKLGINPSVACTTVKPSGTVSQLVDSSSGIHPRYSQYYVRTVRADQKDPLAKLLKDQGVPCEADITKPDNTYVFSFPIKSPIESTFRDDRSAIEQLELNKVYNQYWCEHNVSQTIYVKEYEWLTVGAWVYENFDNIGGLSFLPHSNHSYRQAPYQEITKEEYEGLVGNFPVINWEKLSEYEQEDYTVGQQELACTSGVCELV